MQNGTYTVKVTNISKNSINMQVEFGNTNSQEMIPAGVLILVGAVDDYSNVIPEN